MTIAKVVTVGTPVTPQVHFSLGSLPASTDYDQVDVYYDPNDYLGTLRQFTFYLYGTTAGQKTLLKTLGPFGRATVASRILTLRSEPGTTYSLEGALTSGAVIPGATIKGGLVGSNLLVNSTPDIDATPSPTSVPYVPGAQVTIVDISAEHTRWNIRLNMAGNRFPLVLLRAFAVIVDGGNTIQALVGQVSTSNPSPDGFQPFDFDTRTDRFLVTAEALDNRAVGAYALSIAHVGIGSDGAIDGSASAITQLTGDVLAGPGAGSVAATIANGVIVGAMIKDTSAFTFGGGGTGVDLAVGGGGTDAVARIGPNTTTKTTAALHLLANGTAPTDGNAVMKVDAGGNLEIHGSANPTIFSQGGSTIFYMTTSLLEVGVPVYGFGTPYGSINGTAVQPMADSDQTPGAGVYQYTAIRLTGGITANRTLILPLAADSEGYYKLIKNQCTDGGGGLHITVASGANPNTVNINVGTNKLVYIDTDGVILVE